MRLAVIADIHGNFDALEAVVADLDAQSPDAVVNLGDCLSGPLEAAQTADRLLGLGWLTVRGNCDRCLVEQPMERMGPSDRAAAAQLTERHRAWLAALRPTATLEGEVFLCHATPAHDDVCWTERVEPGGVVRAARESELAACMEGVDAGLVLCGHTHIARLFRLYTGQLILNPGSVGLPAYDHDLPVPHAMETGSPHARYAIADRIGKDWHVDFRCVTYDWTRAAELAQAAGRPEWEKALRSGFVR